jgi:hypothetical protein
MKHLQNPSLLCLLMLIPMLLGRAAEGDSLWSRIYGGPIGDDLTKLLPTSDGGWLLVGRTESFGAGDLDFWVVKTDAAGDSLWSRTYGGDSYEIMTTAIQTDDGGYLLFGDTYSFGAGAWDIWMVRTDADGDSLWSHTYGGSGDDQLTAIIVTNDGGYLLGGKTDSFGAGNDDIWLVKTDATGDSLWSATYGGADDEWLANVLLTADGGYLIAGTTMSCGAG